jgi:polyisoprenoid-binding protein YceI
MTASALLAPIVLAAAAMAATPVLTAEAWDIDKPHSEINFSVRHFFTPVSGSFREFDIDLQYDRANPANSTVTVTIDVASIDTRNVDRDQHLMSADFFEAQAHPQITFRSTSVRASGENRLIARGPLTIKGVTREIELPITVLGVQEIPSEMQQMLGGVVRVAGFEAGTEIRRQDFGVGVGSWAAAAVVGSEVTISIAIEANQK